MSTNRVRALIVCLLGSTLGVACAQGSSIPDRGDREDTEPPRNIGATDVVLETSSRVSDTTVRDVSDVPPHDDSEDVESDASLPACARQTCDDAVCNPQTGECVGCVVDEDCPNGKCEASTNSCRGCTSDGDCPGEALCDDRKSVCIPSCCTTTVEQPFQEARYVDDEFAITVTDTGSPSILLGADDVDKLKFANRTDGEWSTENISDTTFGSSADVEIAQGPGGASHAVRGDREELIHHRRPEDQWMSQNIIPDDKRLEQVDIAVDSSGTFHALAILEYGDEVMYATRTPDGTRDREYLTLPTHGSHDPQWINLALNLEDQPVASFQIDREDVLVIAERSDGGDWSYTTVGNDVEKVHGMDIGPDGQPTVTYRNDDREELHVLRQPAEEWKNTAVVDDEDHGFRPDVAVDSLGDPHIVYEADNGFGGAEHSMFYVRWNGDDWERHALTSVQDAESPVITLDGNDTPHIAVYDSEQDSVSYVRID